jgi:hypothetical protein
MELQEPPICGPWYDVTGVVVIMEMELQELPVCSPWYVVVVLA